MGAGKGMGKGSMGKGEAKYPKLINTIPGIDHKAYAAMEAAQAAKTAARNNAFGELDEDNSDDDNAGMPKVHKPALETKEKGTAAETTQNITSPTEEGESKEEAATREAKNRKKAEKEKEKEKRAAEKEQAARDRAAAKSMEKSSVKCDTSLFVYGRFKVMACEEKYAGRRAEKDGVLAPIPEAAA